MKKINISINEILEIFRGLTILAEQMENEKDCMRLLDHIVMMQANLIEYLAKEENNG